MLNIPGFNSALSGLHAQRRILDNTAHNIANESTPGYHRRRVDLSPAGFGYPGVFAGDTNNLQGVNVDGVTRIVDSLAEARALRENAAHAGTRTMTKSLDRLELAFREPSENGIAAQLDEFWSGWTELSNHPDDLGVRTQLLQRADSLVGALHRAAGDIDALESAAVDEMGRLAQQANGLASRIAELNKQIVPGTISSNDLMDQRDLLIEQLGDLTGARTRPGLDGKVDVYVGNRAIVTGATARPIDGSSGSLTWTDGVGTVDAGGQLGALVRTVDDLVPRYRAELDGVAAELVTDVNALHTSGYDLDGLTGWNFFDPANVTADTISISADVAGQPSRVAIGKADPISGGPPGPLDGELGREIAALADRTDGPDAAYRSMIATLGIEAHEAARQNEVQEQVALSATVEADSVGSVSLDEEMATLVSAQRAYEAAARVLTAVDEMLGVLIERTGVVGR